MSVTTEGSAVRAARRLATALGTVLVGVAAGYPASGVARPAALPDVIRIDGPLAGVLAGGSSGGDAARSGHPARRDAASRGTPGRAAQPAPSGRRGSAGALPRRPALVIAHRGASDELPENTLDAYRLAIEEGADYIEGDLVATRDGVLVARHERELAMTTDVAAHPEFAGLRTSKVVNGTTETNWFVEDFTLAELRTLRATHRHGASEVPGGAGPPGQQVPAGETIPTVEELIDLVGTERAAGHQVGLYVELKFPAYFASIGLPLEPRLAAALRTAGLAGAQSSAFVESFDAASLRTMRRLVQTPLVQLVGGGWNPTDPATSPAALAGMAGYAVGLGVDRARLRLPTPPASPAGPPPAGGSNGGPTDRVRLDNALVTAAHAAGLEVHVYTFSDPAPDVMTLATYWAYYTAGVDGVFTDNPDVARSARP